MQIQIIIEKFLRNSNYHYLKLKTLDKLLMFFLSSYMGNKNDCFPSYPTLMKDLGINDRTALSNSLKNLESKNILIIKKTKGKGHHFSFNLEFIPVGIPYDTGRDNPKSPVGNPYSNNKSNNIKNTAVVTRQTQKQSASSDFKGLAKTADKPNPMLEAFMNKNNQ
jgi:helix-turn-helix protein